MIRGRAERRGGFVLASVLVGLGTLGACSSQGSPPAHSSTPPSGSPSSTSQALPTFEIDVTAAARYRLPPAAPAGAVTIELSNGDARHAHGAALYLLHPGVTMSQFTARTESNGGLAAAAALASPAGGPAGVGPRQHGSVIAVLRASSTYAVVSDVAGPGQPPDYTQGLLAGFTTGTGRGVQLPGVPGNQVVLRDGTAVVASSVDWSRPIQVINQGRAAHGLQILAAAGRGSLPAVRRYLTSPSGPVPYARAGGLSPIAPGTTELLNPATPAGRYLVAVIGPGFAIQVLKGITVS